MNCTYCGLPIVFEGEAEKRGYHPSCEVYADRDRLRQLLAQRNAMLVEVYEWLWAAEPILMRGRKNEVCEKLRAMVEGIAEEAR